MTIAIYPSRAQVARLTQYLTVGRVAFNRALEARKHWYETTGKSVSLYEHHADLTYLRGADPFWRGVPVMVARDGQRRCDLAFKSFFRRVKEKKAKAGYPRFKSANRWHSFAVPGTKTCVNGNRVRIGGVQGTIRARNVRPFTGTIKQQRVVRRADKWFCQLVIDDHQDAPPRKCIKSAVGIDMGLKSFAVLSNGQSIANPRFGRVMAAKLRSAHKSVSRKVKGSNRRRKAIRQLQRVYTKISDLRSNFTHQLSRQLVSAHEFIAVEDLNVAGMVRGRFARSILDACWSQLHWQLAYKAENAGCTFVRVDARGTSQECSRCGEHVQKGLSVRVHSCPKCGLVLCRDENAARNVLRRAVQISAPGAVGAGGVESRRRDDETLSPISN